MKNKLRLKYITDNRQMAFNHYDLTPDFSDYLQYIDLFIKLIYA